MKMINVKDVTTTMNKNVDKFGKSIGMNYFERRKFKKTVNNFAYDTGVQVASTLVIDAVEGVAYLAGRGIVIVANGVSTVAKSATHAVSNIVETTTEKIAANKAKKDIEKASNVIGKMIDEVSKETSEEVSEDTVVEEVTEEISEN